jgi:hypothetical protein
MPSDPLSVDRANEILANWLSREECEEGLLGQRGSDELSYRFMAIARRAKFGLAIVVTNRGCIARWTHPRLSGPALPDSGLAPTDDDARVLACAALLQVPAAVQLLDRHRRFVHGDS